jgi:hypothetical protein
VTETFAHLSNNALISATIVYALAMIAHMIEWAMARDLTAEQVAPRSALVAAAGVSAAGERSAPVERSSVELSGAGRRRRGPAPAEQAGAIPTTPRPSEATGSAGSAFH